MTPIKKTMKFVGVINDIHLQYFQDYFETGKIEKVNLSRTEVPTQHIFGARIILRAEDISEVSGLLYGWQEEFGLKNWYLCDKEDYKGLHIYFKNKSNFYFPWELQLWDENDVDKNIQSRRLHKRGFV